MDNADSPSALDSPTGDPLGTETTVVHPSGRAGRTYVGETTNSANTKIEGSTTDANDIDVSYVDGYWYLSHTHTHTHTHLLCPK